MRKPSEIIELTLNTGLYNGDFQQFMCWKIEELKDITDEEIELTQITITDAIFPYTSLAGHLWLRGVNSVAPENRSEALVEWYRNFIVELKEEGL